MAEQQHQLQPSAQEVRWTLDDYSKHTAMVRGKLSEVLSSLSPGDIPENACGVLLTVINKLYWPRLRRAFETPEQAYSAAFDPKLPEKTVVYVPYGDMAGLAYWENCKKSLPRESALEVRELPEKITPEIADRLSREGGFLALAHDEHEDGTAEYLPYYVPGGRFNEVYGWDTDFIAMGLLEEGKLEDVRALIRHHLTEIETFGRVLNANRTYYLTRGQPPLFMHMVRCYAERLSPEMRLREKDFLARCIRAGASEYNNVWNVAPHRTENGLARYYDPRKHFPPETEEGHFDAVVGPHAEEAGMSVEQYIEAFNRGEVKNALLEEYVMHDGAVRESGHDTSNAFVGHAAHLNTVELNALLYKMECDVAYMLDSDFGGSFGDGDDAFTAGEWRRRAHDRARAMQAHLLNPEKNVFEDLNFVTGEFAPYTSPRMLYPLWAGIATQEQAQSIVADLLPKLEERGGLVSCDRASRGQVDEDHPQRQWDYPAGWAPHQIIAWEGLLRYGYKREAQRLIYKWLYMILDNWIRKWCIVEKYDVVTATQNFHAEYGNVGAGELLLEGAGFGWTNSSFQRGLALLEPEYRRKLDMMMAPEEVFPEVAALPSDAQA